MPMSHELDFNSPKLEQTVQELPGRDLPSGCLMLQGKVQPLCVTFIANQAYAGLHVGGFSLTKAVQPHCATSI